MHIFEVKMYYFPERVKIYVKIYAIMKVKNLCKVCLIITVDTLYLATAILGIAQVVHFCLWPISASGLGVHFFTGFFFTFTIFQI